MATTLLVRGSNPVWSFVDLTGHQFDDTFYMWVLENDIPYFPATVWHDVSGNVAWTQPIQFLANGTLPIDIFWDPDVVYRLEFRQHIDPLTSPTQADPLIYVVPDYSPGSGGSTPDASGIITENQIANPQFAEISFTSPHTVTGTDLSFEVAPGWTLELTGTGSVILERVALTSTLTNPTNAPYMLRLRLSGWDVPGVKLIQRFAQNGMLWASTPGNTRYVASSVTARAEGDPISISARLVDSMGAVLQTILTSTQINSSFNEYKGFGVMPATTNTNTPPAAWVEYQLLLPSTADIYLSSFQVVQSEVATNFEYEQTSIDRQIDHLFHYYKHGLDIKPIASFLVGWDFGLNPAQFYGTTVTPKAVGANKSYYAWDQTIVFQTANSGWTITKEARNSTMVATAAVTGQMAIIQYLNLVQARDLFLTLTKEGLASQVDIALNPLKNVTISLWWSDNVALPDISASDSLVTGLDADGYPTVVAGWTEITLRDLGKSSTFINSQVATIETFGFTYFDREPWTNQATLFAIVIGTAELDAGNDVTFKSVSLAPGTVPTAPATKTPDEVLRQCQYYYQKSFLQGTAPATSVAAGAEYGVQNVAAGSIAGIGPIVRFATPMWKTPIVALYNPDAANSQISTAIFGSWSSSIPDAGNQTLVTANGFPTRGTTPGGSGVGNLISVHWVANAVLGQP